MTCREKPKLSIPNVLTLHTTEGLLVALKRMDIWKIPIIVVIFGTNHDATDAGIENYQKKRSRLLNQNIRLFVTDATLAGSVSTVTT